MSPADAGAWARTADDGYDVLASKAAALLERSPVIAKTLSHRYQTLICDEHQDACAARNAVAAGTVVGPRIFTAGPAISTTGGHADHTNGLSMDLQGDPGPLQSIFNGPDEARKVVRLHYKEGADLIAPEFPNVRNR